ncbi:MAG: ABC transporter ATP-binding protein [Thermoleophilia bacterium]|nr:ABC transporter ATP-binding protein [Thermoleophilia bacterium]
MTEAAIELQGLTKRFGARTAVNDVTLTVPTGSVYGLVGPNGAGKTTLMRALLGFTRSSGGTSTVLGLPMPQSRGQVYPRIGVIIEEPRFYGFLTGRRNLRQIAAARSETITEADIDRALATVGLEARADDRVKGYSLGMRQRLGIARALLHDPELLILDEPSNGLDPPGIRDMRVLLRRVASEGRTVLVSSHLLGEMEQLCDYVAVLKDGRLVANGPVDQLTDATQGGAAAGAAAAAAVGQQLFVGVDDVDRALAALTARDEVLTAVVSEQPGVLLVTLAPGVEGDLALQAQAAALVSALVDGGVRVHLVHPAAQRSLEDRFLDIVGDGGIS